MNYRNYNPYKSCFPLNHDTAHCWATLKVESCTRDHISVQKLFSTFSAYYWNVYIFWICCCWENCHTLLKIAFFSYLFSLYKQCFGIQVLKITLLPVHKFVTSVFFFCFLFSSGHFSSSQELCSRSMHGEYAYTVPKFTAEWHWQRFQFLVKIKKIALTSVRSRVRESLAKWFI